MTYDEQHEFYRQLMVEREDLREEDIRQLAAKAAAYNAHSYFDYARPSLTFPPLAASPAALHVTTLSVNLHPSLTGFARVLVAEEIIRKQLGDKL